MKIIRIISRLIIGVLFIFSGTVKAIDPLGSAYKFHDYFMALNLGFLDSLSLPLGILLCMAEFIAGFSVLTGIRHKEGIWLSLLLMSVFTPLTLYLAISNPVTDCGCFGEAIHLTNWQTFAKNVFLIIPAIILFIERNKISPSYKPLKEWIITIVASIIFIGFSVSNLFLLPAIDFMPYKTGVRIADKMIIPEGAAPDLYETTFLYRKDGVTKEFTLNDYPANDSSWIFVDQKTRLLKKGYQPPIHDFNITSPDGNNVTDRIVNGKGRSILMIVRKMGEIKPARMEEGIEAGKVFISNGMDFYLVSSSPSAIAEKHSGGLPVYSADETTLKTIVRSDPGYVLVDNGVIKGKWSWATFPGKKLIEMDPEKHDPEK